MLLFISMLSLFSADDSSATGTFDEALLTLKNDNSAEARGELQHLRTESTRNPSHHFALGRAYQSEGKLAEALREFELASAFSGHTEVRSIKEAATLNKWMRNYDDAKAWLQKGMSLAPDDNEANADLADLNKSRSLHVFGSTGGWEVDYARNVQEAGIFVGWVDWLDMYATYSVSERLFFNRKSFSIDMYAFPVYDTYVRLGVRYRSYQYPQAAQFPPDVNAYRDIPAVQLEVSHHYGAGNAISIEAEYFRPNFFWNERIYAHNIKIGASIRNWVLRPVYVTLVGATLRDPDPESFPGGGTTPSAGSFQYEHIGLVGGGFGFDGGALRAELKYVPNRDLDNSLGWSLFGRVRYDWESFGLQYDMLYDQYSASIARTLMVSRVNMLTVIATPLDILEFRLGAKALSRGTTEVVPFLFVRYRTGI